MTPRKQYINRIISGDCLEKLKALDQDSIDLIVTDPPYGYSFMGKDWDKAVPSVEIWKECLRVLKPGGFAFVMSAPRQDVLSQMIVRIGEAGFDTDFTSIYWTYASGFPKAANIGKMVDKRNGVDNVQHKGKWSFEHGNMEEFYRRKKEFKKEADKPLQSDQAKALDGSYGGFQPKPAVEVIIVAMKPLSEKTFVDQALKNGKGITWLDDCRVPTNGEHLDVGGRGKHGRGAGYGFEAQGEIEIDQTKGRFPANLLVSDDVLNDGRVIKGTGHFPKSIKSASQFRSNQEQPEQHLTDSGSYSRYFDLDAWAKTLPFLITPKAGKREKNDGLDGFEERFAPKGNNVGRDLTNPKAHLGGMQSSKARNHHPTVKPLKLMSYLITLGSRPGDVVLDPFVGSGTTCVAAHHLQRKYIGIEREQEYVDIANARLAAIPPTLPL